MLDEILKMLKLNGEGRLLLKNVPMILTTREFIALIQKCAEEILGLSGAATLMFRAGFQAAYNFAKAQAEIYNLKGGEVLRKYLSIASRRGWGKFEIKSFDEEKLTAKIEVKASYGEEWGNAGRSVCHIWRGALAGIIQYIADSTNKKVRITCKETKCIAKGDNTCEFIITPLQL